MSTSDEIQWLRAMTAAMVYEKRGMRWHTTDNQGCKVHHDGYFKTLAPLFKGESPAAPLGPDHEVGGYSLKTWKMSVGLAFDNFIDSFKEVPPVYAASPSPTGHSAGSNFFVP